MQTKTKMKNEALIKDKYRAPQVLTRVFNETLRKEKEDLAEMR